MRIINARTRLVETSTERQSVGIHFQQQLLVHSLQNADIKSELRVWITWKKYINTHRMALDLLCVVSYRLVRARISFFFVALFGMCRVTVSDTDWIYTRVKLCVGQLDTQHAAGALACESVKPNIRWPPSSARCRPLSCHLYSAPETKIERCASDKQTLEWTNKKTINSWRMCCWERERRVDRRATRKYVQTLHDRLTYYR